MAWFLATEKNISFCAPHTPFPIAVLDEDMIYDLGD